MSMKNRTAYLLGAATLSACLLAGCSSGSADNASGPAKTTVSLLPVDNAIAATLPQAIKDKGTLVFATDATAPPNQSVAEDGKTIVGNEVDFGNQIASILGLKAQFVNVSFDTIIPGLQAGRYDAGLSGFRDTKEREKVVDFVTYAKAGPQLFAKKANEKKITTLDQLCGHSFAVQSGTVQEDIGNEQNTKCTAAGKQPVAVKVFKTQADQVQAVASGQVEVGAQNSPNNVYLAEQTKNALVGIGEPFAEGPWGMPLPKTTGLTAPLHAATAKLLASPQYKEILDKWGVQSQGVSESVINGATS